MRKVILPQAIRTMIPSIINQFIISLKDTSILSVIGFPELTKAGNIIVGNTFKAASGMGHRSGYVHGCHHHVIPGSKED